MTTGIAGTSSLVAALDQWFGVRPDDVIEELRYLWDGDDGDAELLFAGSLAYGLGNGRSDLDVIVMSNGDGISTRVPLLHFVKGLRVDVWKLCRRDIAAIFEAAQERLGRGQGGGVSDADVKLMHRVVSAVEADGTATTPPPAWLEIATAALVEHFRSVASISVVRGHLAHALGDAVAAIVAGRRAAEAGCEAHLAISGYGVFGSKWLYLRLGRHAPELRARLDDALRTADISIAEYVRACTEIATACAELPSAATLLGEYVWSPEAMTVVDIAGVHLLMDLRNRVGIEVEPLDLELWRGLFPEGAPTSVPVGALSPAQAAAAWELSRRGHILLRERRDR